MTDPDTVLVVTAVIGGRKRRLTTVKQLRTAISYYDIERDSEVRIEDEAGGELTCQAADYPVLVALFDEILGPAPTNNDPAAVAAAVAAEPEKPARGTRSPWEGEEADPQPLAPVPDPAPPKPKPLQAKRTSEPVPPKPEPKGKFLGWALALVAGLGLLGLIGGGGSGEEVDPAAAVSDAATDSVIEQAMPSSSASTAPEATATPTEDPVARQRELERERERERLAVEQREARRRAAEQREARRRAAAMSQPTVAPEPPPRVSLAQRARPRGQGSWGAKIASNYPSRALSQGIEGLVGLSVAVGPDGRVQSCTVTASSASVVLDRAACDGMRRHARFEPARDDDGNPTEGNYTTSITYKLAD